MNRSIGIVGVGNMGGAMAARLLGQGWHVQVCDIDPLRTAALQAQGAGVGATPAQATSGCAALIVCVVDARQTSDVLFGAAGAAGAWRAGTPVLLCPTIAPEEVESLAARIQRHGGAAVDAPMSGGPLRAREGAMSLMVACADGVFGRIQPLLDALTGVVFRISTRPGDGARTKLVNNLLAGINLAGAAQALALAQRLGLDLPTTLGVIERSSGQSWIGSDRMHRALAGDLAPRAHMTLLEKDTGLAMQMAAAAGLSAPLGAAAHAAFAGAVAAGLGASDDAALLPWMAQHTGGTTSGGWAPPPAAGS